MVFTRLNDVDKLVVPEEGRKVRKFSLTKKAGKQRMRTRKEFSVEDASSKDKSVKLLGFQ